MQLNFKKYGDRGEPVIILHGLFGMLDNWSTIGRKLSEYFQVYTVDQRNHGKSPHNEVMNYKAMAEDLLAFIEDEDLNKPHIIGHSMGGKTVMQFAVDNPTSVNKLVVVDIAPQAYQHGHQIIFDAFNGLDLSSISSRKEADEKMTALLPEFGVRQFILKNLARDSEGNYMWRPAVNIIERNYEHIVAAIEGKYDGETLFIKGDKSAYIKEQKWDEIQKQFSNAKLATIKDSGHWVHAEQPNAFFDVVLEFLN